MKKILCDEYSMQYKLYIESSFQVTNRRTQTNKFYISLLTIMLGTIPLGIKFIEYEYYRNFIFLSLSILGILLCLLWFLIICAFDKLNMTKYDIIREMEEKLPFQLYKKEREVLGLDKRFGNLQKLTVIERATVVLLSIPYILLLIYAIINLGGM